LKEEKDLESPSDRKKKAILAGRGKHHLRDRGRRGPGIGIAYWRKEMSRLRKKDQDQRKKRKGEGQAKEVDTR